jgi:hypothetical protein
VIEETQSISEEVLLPSGKIFRFDSPSTSPSEVQFVPVIEENQSASEEVLLPSGKASSFDSLSSSPSGVQAVPVAEEIQPAPEEVLLPSGKISSLDSPSSSPSGVQFVPVIEEIRSASEESQQTYEEMSPSLATIHIHFGNVSPDGTQDDHRFAKGVGRNPLLAESSMDDCDTRFTSLPDESNSNTKNSPQDEKISNLDERTNDSRRLLHPKITHSADDPSRTDIRLFVCTETGPHRRLEMDRVTYAGGNSQSYHSSDDVARTRTIQNDGHTSLLGKTRNPSSGIQRTPPICSAKSETRRDYDEDESETEQPNPRQKSPTSERPIDNRRFLPPPLRK